MSGIVVGATRRRSAKERAIDGAEKKKTGRSYNVTRETRDGFNLDLAGILPQREMIAGLDDWYCSFAHNTEGLCRQSAKRDNAILIISGRYSLFIIAEIYLSAQLEKKDTRL